MINNFSRSNVNEETLDISSPLRSSFNLSHSNHCSLRLGELMPVNFEPILPTDVFSGSLNPKFQLEKIVTPSMGRTRLDTHSFIVNARRVNRDFISLRGDNTGSKPSFLYNATMGSIFSYLMQVGEQNAGDFDSLLSFEDRFYSYFDASDPETELVFGNAILEAAISSYRYLISSSDADQNGYPRDFFAIEIERLSNVHLPNDYSHIYAILAIMQPYCGAGSMLDMLGYPCFHQYSQWFDIMKSWRNATTEEGINYIKTTSMSDIFLLSSFEIVEVEGGTEVNPQFSADKVVDETPLRVVYAAWYDYFRNFHVEKREYFLNPDLFDRNPIVKPLPSLQYTIAYFTMLQLILPKYRMYARDYLTTVQTEDKFRFVYTPISTNNADKGQTLNIDIDEDFYNEIVKLGLPQFATAGATMPLPYFSQQPVSNDGSEPYQVSVLRNDLQTMRRSGMLEKWLARNYYYPDTYVGQLLARYQVTPADVSIINAEYIGGNESFISDEQIVSNVGTSETPMGQRVLKADVGLTDNISYTTNDYCYLVSFVSLMPLVSYDSPNMHLHELTSADFPDPEFAEDTRIAIRTCDLLRGFDSSKDIIGYVPRYYQYRVHPDETHGRYLTDYRAYNWFRDWYNMNFTDFTKSDQSTLDWSRDFSLNPYSLRVHIVPDAFLNVNIWDSIAFGKIDIQLHIQRAIPAAVEFI